MVKLFLPIDLPDALTVTLLTGGFGSSLIAMDQRTYELIGPDYPGNRAEDVKNPGLGWMMGFMFVVSFLGLFSLVPLRKVIFVVHYYYIFLFYQKEIIFKEERTESTSRRMK